MECKDMRFLLIDKSFLNKKLEKKKEAIGELVTVKNAIIILLEIMRL